MSHNNNQNPTTSSVTSLLDSTFFTSGNEGEGNTITIEEGTGNVHSGERALWRAVIAQAILDATSGSRKSADRAEKGKSMFWLAGTTQDFRMVCALADQDPDYVIERSQLAIRNRKTQKKPTNNRLLRSEKRQTKTLPPVPPAGAISPKPIPNF